MIDERDDRLREALWNSSAPECYCEARLSHIKRLHEAITCLGLRLRRQHGLNSWEDLSSELPHMLDHIKGIDEQLKKLEISARASSPTPSRASTSHRRYRSEPQNVDRNTSSKDARPRMPSPSESNISLPRSSLSAIGTSTKSGKRSSKNAGFFSNQGG